MSQLGGPFDHIALLRVQNVYGTWLTTSTSDAMRCSLRVTRSTTSLHGRRTRSSPPRLRGVSEVIRSFHRCRASPEQRPSESMRQAGVPPPGSRGLMTCAHIDGT